MKQQNILPPSLWENKHLFTDDRLFRLGRLQLLKIVKLQATLQTHHTSSRGHVWLCHENPLMHARDVKQIFTNAPNKSQLSDKQDLFPCLDHSGTIGRFAFPTLYCGRLSARNCSHSQLNPSVLIFSQRLKWTLRVWRLSKQISHILFYAEFS